MFSPLISRDRVSWRKTLRDGDKVTSVTPEKEDAPRVLGPQAGRFVDLGSLGVRFMVRSEESGRCFSLVEHPMPSRMLAAPLHRHAHEDEDTYVLEGKLGALLGEDVVYATPSALVFESREQWHTFWNVGEGPCRILEIISPGGFEAMFPEMTSDPESFTGEAAAEPDAMAGIEVDYDSITALCAKFGLAFPM
jgi:mannose-6-phosphate isomerase-like protein (cupin superfamily)